MKYFEFTMRNFRVFLKKQAVMNICHTSLTGCCWQSSVYMERILPGCFSSRPGKAGQFLSYKHSVPLRRDDIMLTLQIVPGEIVQGRNILL